MAGGLFTSFWGFTIHNAAEPRLGLSVHTLSSLEGVMLLALGLAWPKLRRNSTASRVAFWLLVYSALAILAACVLAAYRA